jgi:hypothetical protein
LIDRRRPRTAAWIAWLVLAAVSYRALIPAGFMPGTAEQVRAGAVLVLCSGGLLKTERGRQPPQAHAYSQCAFAAAAAPGLVPRLAAVPLPSGAAAHPGSDTPQAASARRYLTAPARAPPSLS